MAESDARLSQRVIDDAGDGVAGRYLTCFTSCRGPTSAPNTLPCLSTANPSAALVGLRSSVSGIKYKTSLLSIDPTRTPRFHPGCIASGKPFDSESVT